MADTRFIKYLHSNGGIVFPDTILPLGGPWESAPTECVVSKLLFFLQKNIQDHDTNSIYMYYNDMKTKNGQTCKSKLYRLIRKTATKSISEVGTVRV